MGSLNQYKCVSNGFEIKEIFVSFIEEWIVSGQAIRKRGVKIWVVYNTRIRKCEKYVPHQLINIYFFGNNNLLEVIYLNNINFGVFIWI